MKMVYLFFISNMQPSPETVKAYALDLISVFPQMRDESESGHVR